MDDTLIAHALSSDKTVKKDAAPRSHAQATQDRDEESEFKAKTPPSKADAKGDLEDTCKQKASDFEARHWPQVLSRLEPRFSGFSWVL